MPEEPPSCPSPRVVRHSNLHTRRGTRRRYRCKQCGATFSANAGTVYHRMKYPPETRDRVISMSVEGMSKAAIARVVGVSVSSVTRWIAKAARHARSFADGTVRNLDPTELLRIDELKSYEGRKTRALRVYTAVEVWSRLWASSTVDPRILRNTRLHLRDVSATALPLGEDRGSGIGQQQMTGSPTCLPFLRKQGSSNVW